MACKDPFILFLNTNNFLGSVVNKQNNFQKEHVMLSNFITLKNISKSTRRYNTTWYLWKKKEVKVTTYQSFVQEIAITIHRPQSWWLDGHKLQSQFKKKKKNSEASSFFKLPAKKFSQGCLISILCISGFIYVSLASRVLYGLLNCPLTTKWGRIWEVGHIKISLTYTTWITWKVTGEKESAEIEW